MSNTWLNFAKSTCKCVWNVTLKNKGVYSKSGKIYCTVGSIKWGEGKFGWGLWVFGCFFVVFFFGVLLVFISAANSSKIKPLVFLFTFLWSEMPPPTRNICSFNLNVPDDLFRNDNERRKESEQLYRHFPWISIISFSFIFCCFGFQL